MLLKPFTVSPSSSASALSQNSISPIALSPYDDGKWQWPTQIHAGSSTTITPPLLRTPYQLYDISWAVTALPPTAS